MSESAAFYEEILYPLQTGVLSALANSRTGFYLTGGTALHRHYFRERYSDDLGLFVNREPEFRAQADHAVAALEEHGYRFDPGGFIRGQDFVRAVVRTPEAVLQLDFVNDTAPRFGSLASGNLFPRIDALGNILSNKLTALFRLEPKDFADLWTIANAVDFHWGDAVAEAGQKLLGSSAPALAELIRDFPPRPLRFHPVAPPARPGPVPRRSSPDGARSARGPSQLPRRSEPRRPALRAGVGSIPPRPEET